MADGSTLKTAMKTIKEDQLFWTREVYERVLFQQLRTPRDPKGKGKGKDKGKKGGKTKGVYQDHLKTNPGKGNGKHDKASKAGRPNGWPQNWALQASNVVQYCRDFHLKHTCPGNCGRSHACPVRVNWTPELIAGMIQRAGETRPTNDEPVRAPIDGTGDLADYFVPASKPQFSNPTVRPAPSGPEPTNSPVVQEDLPKPCRGESPMAPWTLHNCKHFFHGPPLSQSGSNKGSFGTHQYHHMRCRHQASYCCILARQTLRVLTPCS